jgi:hypothetical protein
MAASKCGAGVHCRKHGGDGVCARCMLSRSWCSQTTQTVGCIKIENESKGCDFWSISDYYSRRKNHNICKPLSRSHFTQNTLQHGMLIKINNTLRRQKSAAGLVTQCPFGKRSLQTWMSVISRHSSACWSTLHRCDVICDENIVHIGSTMAQLAFFVKLSRRTHHSETKNRSIELHFIHGTEAHCVCRRYRNIRTLVDIH